MNILAFDTSTDALSVALCAGTACFSVDEAGGPRASERLLPACVQLLDEAGISLADLDVIAIGTGPGAFTGLRTSVAVAQGLAFGAHLPIASIDTLLAQAETAFALHGDDPVETEPGDLVLVANDARMGEMYWALHRVTERGWERLSGPAVHSPDAAVAAWVHAILGASTNGYARMLACGNAWAEHDDALSQALATQMAYLPGQFTPDDAASPPPDVALAAMLRRAVLRAVSCTPSALAVARLGRLALADGRTVSAEEAQPLYVRDKVALTTAERELARVAAAEIPAAQELRR